MLRLTSWKSETQELRSKQSSWGAKFHVSFLTSLVKTLANVLRQARRRAFVDQRGATLPPRGWRTIKVLVSSSLPLRSWQEVQTHQRFPARPYNDWFSLQMCFSPALSSPLPLFSALFFLNPLSWHSSHTPSHFFSFPSSSCYILSPLMSCGRSPITKLSDRNKSPGIQGIVYSCGKGRTTSIILL